jgi:hypothetical protein
VDQPQDDQADQSGGGRVEGPEIASGGDVETEQIGQRDGVEQGNLPLQRAVALLEQRAPARARGLAHIGQPAENGISPPHGAALAAIS